MPASPDPAASSSSRDPRPAATRTPSVLGIVALVLAGLSSVCLLVVLGAAIVDRVVWGGFTLVPAVFFPVAFMLLCVELARGALRRRRR